LWVRNDAPNTLIFTDDANTDHNLLAGGGVGTSIDVYITTVAASGSSSANVYSITANNQTAIVRCEVVGRSAGNQSAGYVIFGLFEDVGGTLTQIGSTNVISSIEDSAGWDATFNVSGSNVQVTVTNGDGSNTADFHIIGVATEQA